MAVVTLLGSQFLTASGTKTVTASPAVGDLIVIVTAHTGNTSTAAPTDDNQSGTYTKIGSSAVKATSADIMQFWVRNNLIGNATSTVFTHAPGTSTGGGLAVIKITGMSKFSSYAVRQSALQSNQASGTPTPVFGSAALTGNSIIGAVFNASNTAALTPRASPAYSELLDTGYNSPAAGLEVMAINSGETATSIAWGGSSATAYCSFIVELDTTSPTAKMLGALGAG